MNGGDGTWKSRKTLWDALEKDESLEESFLAHVSIGRCGGLREIGFGPGKKEELWYSSRYISSTILLLFVVYNVSFLFGQDLATIRAPQNQPYPYFLVSNIIAEKMDLKMHAPQKVLAFLELCILILPLSFAIKHTLNILCKKGFAKWQATAHLAWFTLPDLSCFSAIKVLQFVTPQQLMYDLNYIIWYEPKVTQKLKLIMFAVRTPLAWMIGLDSFLIKVRLAKDMIEDKQCTMKDMMGVIILLNQILGVVPIAKTIRNRLYRFVFAGEDGMMTEKESIRQDVWEAKIAERIFREYTYWPQACALLLSWCDDDFQMMCLNDEEDQEDQAPKHFQSPRHGKDDDGSEEFGRNRNCKCEVQ